MTIIENLIWNTPPIYYDISYYSVTMSMQIKKKKKEVDLIGQEKNVMKLKISALYLEVKQVFVFQMWKFLENILGRR